MKRSIPYQIAFFSSLFSILVGAVVLTGWILQLPNVAALFLPIMPMHFLCGLGFLACGVTLLLTLLEISLIGAILSAAIALTSLTAFLQKLPHSFTGILVVLKKNIAGFQFIEFPHTTLLPFFLVSASLFLLNLQKKPIALLLTCQILLLAVFTFSVNSFITFFSYWRIILGSTEAFTLVPSISATLAILTCAIFLYSLSLQAKRLPIQRPFILIGEILLILLIAQFYQILEYTEQTVFQISLIDRFIRIIGEFYLLTIVIIMAFNFFVFFYLNREINDKINLIQASAEKLASVINSCADAIISIDSRGTIIDWNPGAEKILGYSKEEILGKSINIILPEKYRQNHLQAIARVASTKQSTILGTTRELEAVRKDNTEFPIELTLGMWENPLGTFFTGVVRDRTENKKAEADLHEGKRLAEEANQMKSNFLTMMSHEIRTPLTSILGYTDLLLTHTLSPSSRFEFTQIIKRSSNLLLQTVNDILDSAKIEAGKLTVEKRFFSPQTLFTEILSVMRERSLAKGLKLDIEFATSIPETMFSDPTLIRQIVLNLLSNAIKFTSEGSVKMVLSMATPPDASTQLFQVDVIDTGIGMTQEQIDKIFQPFTQADVSTSRKFGGTGLGLSISENLVEILEGTISCKSQVNKGTTFSFAVDTGPSAGFQMIDKLEGPKADESPSSQQIHLGGRFLLAEDTPESRRLIETLLSYAGATVDQAENGKIASEKGLEASEKGQPYDIILMDIMMPIMDGYDATALLRSKGYKGIIIALTASSDEGSREKCSKVGCDDIINKPIQQDAFLSTLKVYLDKIKEGQ